MRERDSGLQEGGARRPESDHQKNRAGELRPENVASTLEIKFQPKLHESGIIDRVCDLSKSRTGHSSIRWPELRVVEEIEELGAELDIHSFSDCSFLKHSEVEVDHALLPESGIDTRFVAEGPRIVLHASRVESARSGETGCVEPFRHSRYRTS